MAVTTTDDTESIVQTATVAVRVPNGADGDLTRESERRLSKVDAVTDVAVEGIRGLEPGLSATVVTVEATIRAEYGVTVADLRDRLPDGPGVEDVAFAD